LDSQNIGLDLRSALRRLAKAVVVVTTRHEGKRHAMAATAVSELSMEPPSMLICVNKAASLHPVLSAGAGFCINILHSSHGHIAGACSGQAKGEARFEVGEWIDDGAGLPRLAGAQASIICKNELNIDYGSHTIFIGKVDEVFLSGDVDPLVYVDGRYTATGREV
jgi:flavin reductase (DIM6/NTAB) family NADH-FMN oxidoreductase RutF